MKVNIVNYEEGLQIVGILTKYSYAMQRELAQLGVDCSVASLPDPKADINHHVNYLPYRHVPTVNTLMITHFTQGTMVKLNFIKSAMETADRGICFSSTMVDFLAREGIPKLDFVLPAHDCIPRRPKRIAVLTKVYPDRRKREWMLADLCNTIDKRSFSFLIMGDGWQPTIEPLIHQGFDIQFWKDFDIKQHLEILNIADFLLYTGDEDCMPQSMLEATQAGVRTIAPVHDWQNDLSVDYTFNTQEELNAIFACIAFNPVADWTWRKYSERHLEIWKSIISTSPVS